MKTFLEAVNSAMEIGASDLFIISGQPITCKAEGKVVLLDNDRIMPDTAEQIVKQAYTHAGRDMHTLLEKGDDDFAVSVKGVARLRMNAFKQRGSLAAVVRLISFGIPDYRKLGIPEEAMSCADEKQGLVIVSGVAGSGKSTTLACLIDRINHTKSGHIITLEDPIEFLYRNDKCIISQREIGIDTADYLTALRASLRQSPNVILLGEMRDRETTQTAMTAAETGHLVLSTLHTRGAAATVSRIIDLFPAEQQTQVRAQLSYLLKAVISEQLIPTVDGSVVASFEIMTVNNAIRNLIRDSKLHQIDSIIATSAAEGMISMDQSLTELYRAKRITRETALMYAANVEMMDRRLR